MFARSALKSMYANAKTSTVVSRKLSTENFLPAKRVPQLALLVGGVALTFQLTVLYPWHHELSDSFDEVNKVIEHTKNEGIARKLLLETAKAEGNERKAIASRLDKQLSEIDAKLDPQLELEAVNRKLDLIMELISPSKKN